MSTDVLLTYGYLIMGMIGWALLYWYIDIRLKKPEAGGFLVFPFTAILVFILWPVVIPMFLMIIHTSDE